MKIFVKFLSLLFVLMALQSHATTTFPAYKIQNIGGKSFVLSFDKKLVSEAELRIEDEKGLIVWKEEIGLEHPQAKKYNLEQLPMGSYLLVIEDELKIEKQKLEIKSNSLFIDSASKKVEYKPTYVLNGRKLNLQFLQLNRSTSIRISDAAGRELLSEEMATANNLSKTYNLDALPNGRYFISVSAAGDQYRYSFELE